MDGGGGESEEGACRMPGQAGKQVNSSAHM